MALETRLEARLAQKLVLTPQLQQAIKLLQLPQLELSQAINQEIIENPFLEEEAEELSAGETQAADDGRENQEKTENGDTEYPLETLTTFSVDEYFEERGSDGRDLGYFTSGLVEKPGFETFLTSGTDLTDYLEWQLGLSNASPEHRVVAEMIIGNLDENGYLRATSKEMAVSLGVEVEVVERTIALVQSFDPPGVCARDIQECLLLQIKVLGLAGSLVEKIISLSLGDLEKRKYPAIAKTHHVTVEEVQAAVKIIESLEPKPGRIYSNTQVTYVVPDVFVEKVDDEYRIMLNDDNIPRIRISSAYREILQNKKMLDKEERLFLLEKYKSAMWLIKSLDERNKTIYRVTESLLRQQREFFDNGMQYLRPLNLKLVADDISMHESNISRVTSNKYLSCSHGLFPFRFFFSSSIQSDNGDISSTTVKDLIRKIVSEEDRSNPMTDKKIVEILNRKNIRIARRTLAKYREELKIPSHTKRRS
ncbi:MAG: RNA polymerase factor sigma-54 [Nitrospirae bacterium]|nr:RNA polymerase factor sigma-54 [Nitrospirota bacterium]